MVYLVDSHAHLDLCADTDLEIKAAGEQGVAHILSVGFDEASSRGAVEIASRHRSVSAAVGVHPHDAAKVDTGAMERLKTLAALPEVVAIGETGLDYYRDRSPRQAQKESFLRHIDLAHRTGLTLIVHTREAAADTLEILRDHGRDLNIVLHCFSLPEYVDECARNRYFMSMAGNVTFPKAAGLRQAAQAIPEDLLLSETDMPWLTPVPHRGKPNQPAYVRFVVEELARLRNTEAAALAEQIFANFAAAFPAAAPRLRP